MYVERERQFMKDDLSYSCMRSPKYSSDVQAQALLQEYCPTEKKNAARVTHDNNSLFSAVSVALTGNEKLASELRVRCCIEMVVYEAFYMWQERYKLLSQCAPEYKESCLNCATPNEDSCVWTVSALATVVRKNIESVYPAVNGKMDRAVKILNTVFSPRYKVDTGENLKIFWSSCKKTGLTPGSWVPDLFVPLVDMPVVPLSPMVVSPYLTPSRVSGRVRKPTAKVMAITSPKMKNQMKVFVENTVHAGEDDSDEDPDFEMPSSFTLEPADDEPLLEKYQLDKVDFNWMDKYDHVAEGGKPLRGTSFLPAQEVFNEITSVTEVCRTIPSGKKEDVFFIVDNSRNLRYKNRRNYFQDDCGRYNQRSGTTCKSFYLLSPDNLLQQLIKDKGKYCKESRRVLTSGGTSPRGRGRPPGRSRGRGRGAAAANSHKITKWIPMEPQPDDSKIIVLHRYYSCLEVDPSYRRRICWFSNLPETIEKGHDVFLVEYVTKPVPGLQLPKSRKMGSAGNVQSSEPGSDSEMAAQAGADADIPVQDESQMDLASEAVDTEEKQAEEEMSTSQIEEETEEEGDASEAMAVAQTDVQPSSETVDGEGANESMEMQSLPKEDIEMQNLPKDEAEVVYTEGEVVTIVRESGSQTPIE